jgi:hypothetical protein
VAALPGVASVEEAYGGMYRHVQGRTIDKLNNPYIYISILYIYYVEITIYI